MKRALLVACVGVVCHAAHAQEQSKDVLPQGIHVEPKYFEPTGPTGRGGLGFAYSINTAIATTKDKRAAQKKPPIEAAVSDLSLDFQARGNVALNESINPSDFLKTGLNLGYVHSRVGLGAPQPGPGCDLLNPDTVDKCESLRMSVLRLELGLIASLESDQKFDKQAKAYGGHVTVGYQPPMGSLVNQLNPFDWPFRLTRSASGYLNGSAPSPSAFPVVRLALEKIKPEKDPDREAILASKEDYDRANIELALSTPAAIFKDSLITFDWSWRYFRELDPHDAIKAAKLDRFRYSAASLRLDAGWRITYATGRLPLDRQSDKVWEVGYKVQLK